MEKIITIIGQTSSGKSDLAVSLAKKFNGEIVSADSRQVYKGLDFCSGKITKEEMQEIPHHMIDVADLGKQFTLYDFQTQAYECIDRILKKQKLPFVVGGTGLWTRSIVEGFELCPDAPDFKLRDNLQDKTIEELTQICEKSGIFIDKTMELTKRRLIRLIEKNGKISQNSPRYKSFQIGIRWSRQTIYNRIFERLKKRMPNMILEIQNLLKNGADKNFLVSLGLEAKYVIKYLDGDFSSFDEFFEELFKQERHFAKRQDTWLKKEKQVFWIDAENKTQSEIQFEAEKAIFNFLNEK